MLIWPRPQWKGCAIQDLRPIDTAHASAPTPPRAVGDVSLTLALSAGKTRLRNLRQAGCLKCILPRVWHNRAEAVLVNTAGGVTGGDDLRIAVDLGADTHTSITTQACERIYRTNDGSQGRVTTSITVGAGARLDWVPQETILFDRAALDRRLTVSLAADARLLAAETLIFGRAAMGERVQALDLADRIAIDRDGVPLYRDGIVLHGDAQAALARPALGGGAGAVATVIYAAPDAEAMLGPVRALLPDTAGASLRAPGLLLVRALGADGLGLRQYLIRVLERLSGAALPLVWRL